MFTHDKYSSYTLSVVAVVTVFTIIYNAMLPIHPDEAYYWVMGLHPSLCYFDIPPLLAYTIKLFTLAGNAEWVIRLTSVAYALGSSYYIYRFSIDYYTPRAALWAVAIFLTLPVTQVGLSIVTTDAPMTFFWLMGLYHSHKALTGGRSSDFALAGVAVGLGLISKYSMIMLPASIVLYLVAYDRKRFLDRRFWMTVIIAFLLFLPVLVWNYNHEWAGLLFRYKFGSPDSYDISFYYVVEYILGLMMMLSPVFFLYLLYLLVKGEKEGWQPHEKFLFFIAAVFFLYFLYKALFMSMAPNWYSPIAIMLIVVVAGHMEKANRLKLFAAGLALTVAFSAVIKFPEAFGIPAKANPKNKLIGYEEAVRAFTKHLPENAIISGKNYTTASILRYYLPEFEGRIYEPFTDRTSDFDFWTDERTIRGEDVYLFADRTVHDDVAVRCGTVKLLEHFVYHKAHHLDADFYFYRCSPYKGID
jgi:undecaprenyl-diphosphatase